MLYSLESPHEISFKFGEAYMLSDGQMIQLSEVKKKGKHFVYSFVSAWRID